MFDLPIQHLSAYHLSYEQGTLLYNKLKQGLFKKRTENESIEHFQLLMRYANNNQFEAYEISNFAKNNNYSKHNRSYWQQKPYLGLGPSAHSFNLKSRDWNVSNLVKYIDGIHSGNRNADLEILSNNDRLNEFVITNLRTKWGIGLTEFEKNFGKDMQDELLNLSKSFIEEGTLILQDQSLKLTDKGILISDFIMEKLYHLED
jgi:oxygen-independent coproporphyrinogen-3 oxidase